MKHATALLLAVCTLALLGCGSGSGSPERTVKPQAPGPGATGPGNPAVYRRIEGSTDCAALQAEFDQADANHKRESNAGNTQMAEVATSYMEAADARMREIGCY